MKRFLISIWLALSVSGVCVAGGVQPSGTVELDNISVLSTNWSSVTQPLAINGNIECLMIGITNSMAAGTNSVSVFVQVYSGMDIWRTVYSNSSLTASTVAYPRINLQNVFGVGTNAASRIPTYADQIKVSAYNAGASTNCNVRCWALVSQP